MPTIEITQETYDRLAELATGFATPDDVINQLLDQNQLSSDVTDTGEYLSPSKSKKITQEQIEMSYELAKNVYDGKAHLEDAADILEENGMNRASAKIYIAVLNWMRDGKMSKRTVGAKALECWLERFKDESNELLKNAIQTFELNHQWLSDNGYPVNGKLIKIIEEYKRYL